MTEYARTSQLLPLTQAQPRLRQTTPPKTPYALLVGCLLAARLPGLLGLLLLFRPSLSFEGGGFFATAEAATEAATHAGASPSPAGNALNGAHSFFLNLNGAEPLGWYWGMGFFCIGVSLLAWLLLRSRCVNTIRGPGFEVITQSERRSFIPLKDKFEQLDYLSQLETLGALRLSANLNRVHLSFRRYGYLLEDKNFRNALLVNRRRMRRTLLKDGDVLDLGDLTLLYRDHRQVPITRYSSVTPREGKVQIKFDRMRGPVRKGTPMLTAEQMGWRNFYITKNLVFLGRSENNDCIIKSQGVDYRHAKIERVGEHYKLLDLSGSGNTYVNSRRIEQRMLKDGDDITIGNQRFAYHLVKKPVREAVPLTREKNAEGEQDTSMPEAPAPAKEWGPQAGPSAPSTPSVSKRQEGGAAPRLKEER